MQQKCIFIDKLAQTYTMKEENVADVYNTVNIMWLNRKPIRLFVLLPCLIVVMHNAISNFGST